MHTYLFCELRVQQRQFLFPSLYDGWVWVGVHSDKNGNQQTRVQWMGNLGGVWNLLFSFCGRVYVYVVCVIVGGKIGYGTVFVVCLFCLAWGFSVFPAS